VGRDTGGLASLNRATIEAGNRQTRVRREYL